MTLAVNGNHLSDNDEILYSLYLKDDEYSGDNYISNFYATPIIRLLIRVISELKVNYNYISNLDEIFHAKQLKDGKYNSDS